MWPLKAEQPQPETAGWPACFCTQTGSRGGGGRAGLAHHHLLGLETTQCAH